MTEPTLRTILIVDDDADIQKIARMSLESVGGFTVHTASSGPEALKLALAIKPDLILLDMMMPEMDGMTTMTELRTELDTPIIFMTAKSQAKEVAEYRDAGAINVIRKPFDPVNLAERVRELWTDWAKDR